MINTYDSSSRSKSEEDQNDNEVSVNTNESDTTHNKQTIKEAPIFVSLTTFKIKNDGINLLRSELKERGIKFDENKKQIKPLKNLLKKCLGDTDIFNPVSIAIKDAIQCGKIETTENEEM